MHHFKLIVYKTLLLLLLLLLYIFFGTADRRW